MVESVDWTLALWPGVGGGTEAFAYYAESSDLWSQRRGSGGGHHISAGSTRRPAKLGLSILLAARCHLHVAGLTECRISRRISRLAELAAASGSRQSGADTGSIWHRR